MGITKDAIAKNILYYRKKAGLSQNYIAKKLGVTVPAVSKWENGNNSIDIDTLFELCRVLGVSINDMASVNSTFAPEDAEQTAPHIMAAAQGYSANASERDSEVSHWKEEIIREIYSAKLDVRQLKELKALIQTFSRL